MLLKRTSRIGALSGTRRFLVVAAMIAVIAAAASAAAAGDLAATWRTIAQRAAFPVYRPLQTLGLRFDGVTLARYTGCLLASWGNPQSHAGPHFMIYEPGDTSRCGQPGVANEVATAKINGVKVEVLAQCAAWPKCTVKDGETNGILLLFVPEPAGKHYAIQLQSAHVSLQHFLKIATSFTRVRPAARATAGPAYAASLRVPLAGPQGLVPPQRQPRRQGGRLLVRRQPVHRRPGVLRLFRRQTGSLPTPAPGSQVKAD